MPDAGGPDGGGWDRCTNRCDRPSGDGCQLGTGMNRCLSDDGCNACDGYLNQGNWVCTLVLCFVPDLGARRDGAPSWPFCPNASDCLPGMSCHVDPHPTAPLGRCTR